jgi:hypothetical protein
MVIFRRSCRSETDVSLVFVITANERLFDDEQPEEFHVVFIAGVAKRLHGRLQLLAMNRSARVRGDLQCPCRPSCRLSKYYPIGESHVVCKRAPGLTFSRSQ